MALASGDDEAEAEAEAEAAVRTAPAPEEQPARSSPQAARATADSAAVGRVVVQGMSVVSSGFGPPAAWVRRQA